MARPSVMTSIGISLTCPRKILGQSVYFGMFRISHISTSEHDVKLRQYIWIIQRPEMDVLRTVHRTTLTECLIRPYDIGKKRCMNLQVVHNEVAPIIASLIISCH
ncbi:hypothetical protein TNCV_3002481 [Trichonephila clavipes]|nr:hypothetical protein TNCV_3002481 [Trichonephila clavipes]